MTSWKEPYMYKGEAVHTHTDLAEAVKSYPTENLVKAVEMHNNVHIPLARRTAPDKLKAIEQDRDTIQAEIDRRRR